MIVSCTHCGQRAQATPQHAGRSVPCPACQTPIYVPVQELVPVHNPQDEYRLAAAPPAQSPPPFATAVPTSNLAAWLGCSDELHRERKRILFWWVVPFGAMNALLLVLHPFSFIMATPFSLVCFGAGLLIFAQALYMPFWESRRYRWIRMMFSKETYRWIGMLWGGGWAVGGYGITSLALLFAISHWALMFSVRANAPVAQREPTFEERSEARLREMNEEINKRFARKTPEPEPPPTPVEPAPPPPPDPTPQAKIGWGEVFILKTSPVEEIQDIERQIAERKAELPALKDKDQFNHGVRLIEIKRLERDIEFLRQLDPERPPPKAFMQAESKRRWEERSVAEAKHRDRTRAWAQAHFLENLLEEDEIRALEVRYRRAEEYLSRWPVP